MRSVRRAVRVCGLDGGQLCDRQRVITSWAPRAEMRDVLWAEDKVETIGCTDNLYPNFTTEASEVLRLP